MNISPGTVSKILWHFTSGPLWDSKKQKQSKKLKANDVAYNSFKSILRSKELRLGSYREVVKVEYEKRRKGMKKGEKVKKVLESSPVCCLADIPIQHLRYHALRYGKFAIGYHRDSAIKNSYNPVFYSLENTEVVRGIYDGISSLAYFDAYEIKCACSNLEGLGELRDEDGEDVCIEGELSDIESAAEDLEYTISYSKESLENFLAFVKTFTSDELDSIYCEREWRSLKSFKFDYSDIAMLILPKETKEGSYVDRILKEMKIPRTVPVISWEDIVEH